MRFHRRDSYHKITSTLLAAIFLWSTVLPATEIRLKDGRTLRGMYGQVASLTDQPAPASAEGGGVPLIGFVDNDLCRIFFPFRHVVEVNQVETSRPEKFTIRQPVVTSSQVVKAVGPACGSRRSTSSAGASSRSRRRRGRSTSSKASPS